MFYPRLKKNKELQKVQDVKEVKQNIHLIRAPLAGKQAYTGAAAFSREMESFCGPCNWVPANFLRINFFFHVNILSHLGYDLIIYKKY